MFAPAAEYGNLPPQVIRATNSIIIEHMRRYDRPRRLNRRSESAVPCPSAPTTNRRRTSTINTKPVETQSNEIEQDRTDSNASRSPNAVFFSQRPARKKVRGNLKSASNAAPTAPEQTEPCRTKPNSPNARSPVKHWRSASRSAQKHRPPNTRTSTRAATHAHLKGPEVT